MEVYEGLQGNDLITDFDVTLQGPSSGVRGNHPRVTAGFTQVTPGIGYSVSVSPGTRPLFQGVRVGRQFPKEATFSVASGEVVRVVFRVVRKIELVSVDHHFVPGPESCNITYNILGYEGVKVFLAVVNENHNPRIIYQRELTATEKANGNGKTLVWDGKCNCPMAR